MSDFRLQLKRGIVCAVATLGSALLFAPAALAQAKLTIGSSVHSLFSLPLYVADSKGLFKKEGLQVEVINFQGGATATPALLGGSVQLQSAGTENMLKVVQQGQPVVAVMSVQSTFNSGIVVSKKFSDKLGRKPTLADLKGMRVGTLVRGGMTDIAMRMIMDAQGLTEKDVELVPLRGYDKHLAAMMANDIDASVPVEPVQTQWTLGPAGSVYMIDMLKGEGPALFQDMNWITLQGKKDWIDKNRDTVRKVVRAMVAAQAFIADPANLDQVTELAAQAFPDVPKPILRTSINNQRHTYNPRITEAGIAKNNELLLKTGGLRAAVPYKQVVDSSYADLWEAYPKK
jgi:NitT/TauT family transport system substrate-binding protein